MMPGGEKSSLRPDARPLLIFIIILFTFTVYPFFIPTASALTRTPEKQLGLADHFFSRQAYERAMFEYESFRYFFPAHENYVYAGFRIALAYFKQQQYDQALEEFEKVVSEAKERQPDQAVEAIFMVSRCYAEMGLRIPATANLERLLDDVDDRRIRDRVFYHLGWIVLETSEEIDRDTIAEATAYFGRVSPDNREAYRLDEMQQELEWAGSDRQGPLASRKNPLLAGGLAVFPGGGYLYCGRFQDALVSLLLNGGMMWAAYEAFDNDLPVTGTMIAFVGAGFYAGSIYGSVSSAHKHNQRLARSFVNDLRRIKVNIGPTGKAGIKGGLTLSF